jgi:hypothetical protein
MSDALHLSSPSYEWLLTIFYISYIVFEPLGIMYKVVPPHIWAAFCVMGWGVCGTLQSATFNWSGMMATRFFLGAFEACFAPGRESIFSFAGVSANMVLQASRTSYHSFTSETSLVSDVAFISAQLPSQPALLALWRTESHLEIHMAYLLGGYYSSWKGCHPWLQLSLHGSSCLIAQRQPTFSMRKRKP